MAPSSQSSSVINHSPRVSGDNAQSTTTTITTATTETTPLLQPTRVPAQSTSQSWPNISTWFTGAKPRTDTNKSQSPPAGLDSTFFKRLYRILKILFKGGKYSAVYPLIVFCYLGISVAKSFREFWGGLMCLRGRKRLTELLHDGYVNRGSLYRIVNLAGVGSNTSIDNPDQTIQQDVEKMMQEIRRIIEALALDPFLIAYYTYVNIEITTSITGALLIYLFFLISAIACQKAMSPLVPLIYTLEKSEGDFRHLHNTIRDSAEPISLLNGELIERKRLNTYLNRLLGKQWNVIFVGFFAKIVMELVTYMGVAVAYGIVAIPIFDGTFDDKSPGEISEIVAKNTFVTSYLMFKFTQITAQGQRYADLAGYTARVGKLLEALDEVQGDDLKDATKE
ncbi:ATP-binding cassette sub- D member 4, partial [Blyttiomyces sp. JEL0837]